MESIKNTTSVYGYSDNANVDLIMAAMNNFCPKDEFIEDYGEEDWEEVEYDILNAVENFVNKHGSNFTIQGEFGRTPLVNDNRIENTYPDQPHGLIEVVTDRSYGFCGVGEYNGSDVIYNDGAGDYPCLILG